MVGPKKKKEKKKTQHHTTPHQTTISPEIVGDGNTQDDQFEKNL